MRPHVLRALLHKELLRQLANRGALLLQLVLLVAAMLLSFFQPGERPGSGLTGGVGFCFVDYAHDGPFVEHLRQNVPDHLTAHVRFRPLHRALADGDGTLLYPQGTGAIQLRPRGDGTAGFQVWFWHPGNDRGQLAPYEAWFWREVLRYNQSQDGTVPATDAPLDGSYFSLKGGLDPRSGLATALVLFGAFFLCVYLQPSLTCEERERGLLLAQALTLASPNEILASKFLFFSALALVLAGLLAGTYNPSVLLQPFFWLALTTLVLGAMGIGLTISTLARTQRAASMAALVYLLAVSLLLYICHQNGIPGLPYLALEYHTPRMLHAALTDSVRWYHWLHLAGSTVLALGWVSLAAVLFHRRGWRD